MTTKTLYFLGNAASGSSHGSLQDGGTAPPTTDTTTKWTIGTLAPTVYSPQVFGSTQGTGTFGSTVLPNASPSTSDCWRTQNTYTGTFGAGGWTIAIETAMDNGSGGTITGAVKLRLRIWASTDPTGQTSVRELTASTQTLSYTASGTVVDASITWNANTIVLTNEYIFFQFALEIDTAGSVSTARVAIRQNATTSVITTTDFETSSKFFYFKDASASGSSHGSLQDGGAFLSTATMTTGWIVGTTAPTVYSAGKYNTDQANGTFGASVLPAAASLGTTDAFRTENALSGTFASANWVVNVALIARNSSAGGGALTFRLYRSKNVDGSSATEITSSLQTLSTVSLLGTGTQQNTTLTFNPGAFTLTSEYLFFQFAWKITANTLNAANSDVAVRVDSANSVIITSTFTPMGPTLGAVSAAAW